VSENDTAKTILIHGDGLPCANTWQRPDGEIPADEQTLLCAFDGERLPECYCAQSRQKKGHTPFPAV
jgi:hypothetical protein